MDNAGGSQVPIDVIDAISAYMRQSFVQVGGTYPASKSAEATVAAARRYLLEFFGDDLDAPKGAVVIGPSTTQLINNMALSLALSSPPSSEFIVAESGHEANVGAWTRLSQLGFKVSVWRANPDTGHCEADALRPLLNEKVRIVALPHTSNLLGSREPIEHAIDLIHGYGAEAVVDGVAFAPHARIDVLSCKADWYVFSAYKVFGPHLAAMWGNKRSIEALKPINHFFIANDGSPYAFEPGGVNHELCAGITGTQQYLTWLGGSVSGGIDEVARLEAPLTEHLLGELTRISGIRIVGSTRMSESRFPTVSFVHDSVPNEVFDRAACLAEIGIKTGHFYSYRLCEQMGIEPNSGVVRVSLSHTNTHEEIERLITALRSVC
jgi:selenocysteine lyase/cysteine desulfurase